MGSKSKTKNETFWPDALVDREHGALGWTPLARTLTANWWRFGLTSEYFTTIVWLLTWVRNDLTNVRFSQVAVAKQQGVHRSTIYRQMKKLAGKYRLIQFITPTTISLVPFMEKLSAFEAERQREKAVKSFDERLKAVGLHEDKGGRPPKADQPSTAAFGEPAYAEMYAEHDLEVQFVEPGAGTGPALGQSDTSAPTLDHGCRSATGQPSISPSPGDVAP